MVSIQQWATTLDSDRANAGARAFNPGRSRRVDPIRRPHRSGSQGA